MKKLLCVLMSLVMVLGLLAGCGGGDSSTNPSNVSTEEGGGNANPGRTDFVFGLTSEPPLLTPYMTDEYTVFTINYQIFDRLIEQNASDELVPSLAESWSLSDDGLEMTFNIRQGVKFHNGEELTAEDVVYSFNQAIASANTSSVTSAMQEMQYVDTYVCKLILKEPFGPVESCIASPYMGIVNKAAIEADPDGYSRNPIGTGPYQFVSWDIGDKLTLKAFDDYWRGAPTIKDLTFKICLDTSAALVALENGEIDLCDTIPVTQKTTVEGNPAIAYASATSTATYFLQVKTDEAPFNDVRVRQALSCAMNREEIVIGSTDGNAIPIETMMQPEVVGYPKGFKSSYGYDPERAKELLAEAGYNESNPLVVEFTVMDDSRMLPIAEVIAEELRMVGVTATIEKYERAAWLNKVRVELDYKLALMNTSAYYSDADYLYGLYHSDYANGNGRNWGNVQDPKLDELLEAGRAETDPTARAEIYKQVVELMDEQAFVPHILCMDQPYFYNSSLKGFVANSSRRCFVYDYSW